MLSFSRSSTKKPSVHAIALCLLSLSTWACRNSPQVQGVDWLTSDELAASCLNLSPQEEAKFRHAGDLLDLRPVALPRDEWLHQDEEGEPLDHLGWPVGFQFEDTLYVLHMRVRGHSSEYEPGFCAAAVARSTDGGRTFHPHPGLPRSSLDDLDSRVRDFTPENVRTHFGSWGNAAAVIDGKIIVTNFRGVYRSDDGGVTWSFLENAGLPAQLPTNAAWSQGPQLLVHPAKGLVSIGATTQESLLFRSSLDFGETWTEEAFQTDEPLQEPTGIVHDGELVLLPRHNRERWTQYWSTDGWLPLRSARTNITPGERDTTDLQYNPVSERFEAVVTNRVGGGPGAEDENCMTINLWSILPDDLRAGKSDWRFDGTLLRSEGREHDRNNSRGLDRDGMHPGGSVMDVKAGVQRIYVYLGFFPGPAGVFQVTRSLDTEALRSYLLTRR